jgi:hypothetical protein
MAGSHQQRHHHCQPTSLPRAHGLAQRSHSWCDAPAAAPPEGSAPRGPQPAWLQPATVRPNGGSWQPHTRTDRAPPLPPARPPRRRQCSRHSAKRAPLGVGGGPGTQRWGGGGTHSTRTAKRRRQPSATGAWTAEHAQPCGHAPTPCTRYLMVSLGTSRLRSGDSSAATHNPGGGGTPTTPPRHQHTPARYSGRQRGGGGGQRRELTPMYRANRG